MAERWKEIERVPAPFLIPPYGPLKGMRVLLSGTVVACTFPTTLLGEWGAEIIQIERPGVGDPYRGQFPQLKKDGRSVSAAWAQNARNKLSVSLHTDMKIPESKEVFLSLIKNSDVWIENLVWLDKLGLNDEMLLEVNPSLVILHVSGFGKPQFGGLPEWHNRGSYDPIGQAESGWFSLNGPPEPEPPAYAKTFINDYVSALFGTIGVLLAYFHAQKTGEGQVVDIAQAEAMMRAMDDCFSVYFNTGIVKKRNGNRVGIFQPADLFKTKDERFVFIGTFGKATYDRGLQALDLSPEDFPYEQCGASKDAVDSPLGQELYRRIQEWVAQRTAVEVQERMNKFKIPCAIIKNIDEVANEKHWQLRGDFIEYTDETISDIVKVFGFVPKFSKTPGTVWRGAPRLGQDTYTVLSKLLGYSDKEIAAFRAKGIIGDELPDHIVTQSEVAAT